nr:hypothetical protein GTC16762_33840 [Pigmentibacter ruber]
MTEYNLSTKEALKLILDNKKVISNYGIVYCFNQIYNKIKYKSICESALTSIDYFLSLKNVLFKEYIEPKKPRKFVFEAYLGEDSLYRDKDENFSLDMIFSSAVSDLVTRKELISNNSYNRISKFKITMEEMLE